MANQPKSATVPLVTNRVSLMTYRSAGLHSSGFLKGPQGLGLLDPRTARMTSFLSFVQVSFPTTFRTSFFLDLSSQEQDLGPKITSKSEPGGTPETTKNQSCLKKLKNSIWTHHLLCFGYVSMSQNHQFWDPDCQCFLSKKNRLCAPFLHLS